MAIQLRQDNPYVLGKVLKFSDGSIILDRVPIVYKESAADKFHTMREFDTYEDLAFLYYQNSKYWWILTDVNNIIFPFEYSVGNSIIIPNLNNIKIQL